MFAGSNSISLQVKEEDDDDLVINLCDFEFNLNLQDSLLDVERIREFSKNISYVGGGGGGDNGMVRMWADDWFIVLDFVPFIDFYNFSLVCSSFSELLTFNRRYLVMKKILKDFPTLLQDSHHTKVESLRALMVERSPTDDPTFDKQLLSDVIHFLLEKKRYKQDIFKYIPSERIPQMNQNMFITPFRSSMVKKTFFDFPDIPEIIRNDKSFILKFFNSYHDAPRFFYFLKDSLKEDEEIAKKAVSINGWFISLIKKPTAEMVNLALQSKQRYTIQTFNNPYDNSMFPKYTSSLLVQTPNCYPLANEKSILSDYRKLSYTDRITYFHSLIVLDEMVNNKNCEFFLQLAYFEKSPELRSVLYYYNRVNGGSTYDLEDDFITDLLCFPERFDYLSKVMTVHESLKCKTREITVSKILTRFLDDDFTFNLTFLNKNMRLTSASIEYLRDRLINRKKVTATFAKRYFNKQIEPLFECSEDEKLLFCNELATNRELNLKMLKYYPQFYDEFMGEEWKKDAEFMRIAMSHLSRNGSYFDFSMDEMLVLALSSNVKRTIRYLRRQADWEARKQQLLQIFLNETNGGTIREKWLTWPQVFQVAKSFLWYNTNNQSFTDVFTEDDMVKMIEYIPPRDRKQLYLHTDCTKLIEKIGMKNLVQPYPNDAHHILLAFKYCVSYKNYLSGTFACNGDLIKYQLSHNLLSEVLKQTPKFVKVFFVPRNVPNYYSVRRLPPEVPFDMIKTLAMENPRIIYYLPKPIQKQLSHVE